MAQYYGNKHISTEASTTLFSTTNLNISLSSCFSFQLFDHQAPLEEQKALRFLQSKSCTCISSQGKLQTIKKLRHTNIHSFIVSFYNTDQNARFNNIGCRYKNNPILKNYILLLQYCIISRGRKYDTTLNNTGLEKVLRTPATWKRTFRAAQKEAQQREEHEAGWQRKHRLMLKVHLFKETLLKVCITTTVLKAVNEIVMTLHIKFWFLLGEHSAECNRA